MNIIDRLEELNERICIIDSVTIQDAIRLIELYDDALLTIARIDPNSDFSQSESGMINLIHMVKNTIAHGQPHYNPPPEEK
jgi:hypothetical protein